MMKTYLALIAATALALTACNNEKPAAPVAETAAVAASNVATATATAASAVTEAASNVATAVASASDECAVTINSDDKMTFDTKELNVKSTCTNFTLTLKHTGTQPKAGMGHNVVITKAADKDAVLADGAAAGADKDYIKPDDARVVAATKLIGGGESDTITFPVNKLAKGESYVFFCSFPGHVAMMSGKVNLVD